MIRIALLTADFLIVLMAMISQIKFLAELLHLTFHKRACLPVFHLFVSLPRLIAMQILAHLPLNDLQMSY